jgi:RNA polymerase-binding transcription factor DksA
MNKDFLNFATEELQRERRALVDEVTGTNEALDSITAEREHELEEHAQQERDSTVLEHLEERQQSRIRDIDGALARIEAGTYGKCQKCGTIIDEERLRSILTTTLCAECSAEAEPDAAAPNQEVEDVPQSGRVPPDLAELDDEELQAHLMELVREDGTVDVEELQIRARNGVVYLEGAVPSEPQREVLHNILTDVAGIEEVVDHLEVERLAWEREDRSKSQNAQDVLPGTIPDQEPYGGTEDPVLTNEEGVPYEPPLSPPPPPHRKD